MAGLVWCRHRQCYVDVGTISHVHIRLCYCLCNMVDGRNLVILVQQLKYVKLCEELMRYLHVFTISTGAGFLPSTVAQWVFADFCRIFMRTFNFYWEYGAENVLWPRKTTIRGKEQQIQCSTSRGRQIPYIILMDTWMQCSTGKLHGVSCLRFLVCFSL